MHVVGQGLFALFQNQSFKGYLSGKHLGESKKEKTIMVKTCN
jgi:hypothetical protein